MTLFRITVEIQAPQEEVWAVMKDIERWHEWTESITSIERLDRGPLAVGSRALIHQPKTLPATWQVTEFNEGKSFSWVTRSPGVQATGHHAVEPIPGGCRVGLSVEYSGLLGPLVARLLRSLTERYLAFEANGLKARCEGSAIPPRAQS